MTAQLERIPAVEQAAAAAADERCRLAADFIPAGARVSGLDAGSAALAPLLPHGCTFELHDLPSIATGEPDVVVALGALETATDSEAVIGALQRSACDVVLSYAPSDLADAQASPAPDRLSLYELAVLFDRHGLRVERSAAFGQREIMLKLRPAPARRPTPPCRVAVLSYNDVGNFGDRLGYHMINALLPAEAEVHHLTYRTLEKARETYDLVVLGIGNSVFAPILSDAVIDVVGRGKAAIGIFGTQYRELIPRPALDRVLDRLDTWFARYEDDVLMYGRGRRNVVHLGDWLIDQFPMSRATEDDVLQVGDDILRDLPLDRTIQSIQRHKNVYSSRLHPLLCALTSAELVAYCEQTSKDVPGIVSGKFRSMLIDVFGRTYPEKKFFVVDREAVARYKARVRRNVATVAERIETILRDVARASV